MEPTCTIILSEKIKIIVKFTTFLSKYFGSSKNSRTFASAFAQKLGPRASRSEFFERLT